MSRQNNNCTFTVEGDNGELKTCSLERMTNSKTKTQVEFCYLHKPSGICKTNTCLTKASFGIDNTATYCARHAPNNYVNIKRKKCKVANCNIIPTFADPSNPRIKITCYKHFEKNQIHTLKKCLNCRRDASHAMPNTNFKIFCVTHAPPDFTRIENVKKNVKSKKSKKSSINESKNTDEITIEPTVNRKVPNNLLSKENSIARESILEIDEDVLIYEKKSEVSIEEKRNEVIIEENQNKSKIEENQTEDLLEYLTYSDDDINDIQIGISNVKIK
jgi:hypothetical protein